MKTQPLAFAFAAACAMASAAGPARDEYQARKARADADYQAAKRKCHEMRGNAKDVCLKDAKTAFVSAKGEAKVAQSVGKGADWQKVDRDRQQAIGSTGDAQYAAARERCDSLSGEARDHCIGDAKKKYGKQ